MLTIEFEIEGQKFVALNGGPLFKFNESISFVVNCETQEEVDYFWGKLTAKGGQESACGWLKDRFACRGKSYGCFDRHAHDTDHKKSGRVMQAMLQMKRIDIKTLEGVYER